jgi:hypothetical protein
MGQAIWAWGNVTEAATANVFNGSDSIDVLTTLISNGQLIEGSEAGNAATAPGPPSDASLQASIVLAFYAYSIPVAWSLSGTKAFVIDAGYPCTANDPLSPTWLDTSVADVTNACYNGALYYLVYPGGDSETCETGSCDGCVPICLPNSFSVPLGLDKLDGSAYGGITLQNLTVG